MDFSCASFGDALGSNAERCIGQRDSWRGVWGMRFLPEVWRERLSLPPTCVTGQGLASDGSAVCLEPRPQQAPRPLQPCRRSLRNRPRSVTCCQRLELSCSSDGRLEWPSRMPRAAPCVGQEMALLLHPAGTSREASLRRRRAGCGGDWRGLEPSLLRCLWVRGGGAYCFPHPFFVGRVHVSPKSARPVILAPQCHKVQEPPPPALV